MQLSRRWITLAAVITASEVSTMTYSKTQRLLRLPEVKAKTGLARSTIYRDIQNGSFPRPVKLGRASAWPDNEVREWLAERARERANS
jgi:prophage regulatory protein